ncbi:uncharacterized protein LOC132063070 [Lycium ferocissimum]|uniref:uncharacterized protein LOC132063070 n=1 Tax=Lycium ferocissimum TaxID=112874 RepID=UPI002815488D|nr:uncharacterized protein LOC132063070 [Lycium ferocissimum]
MECVTTVNYSIIINGEPATPFDAARGLRQGDPMSPLFFVVVTCLSELKEEKQFKFHPKCSELNITHLRFADAASGIHANLSKSAIYNGGVSDDIKQDIQQRLGYEEGDLPFRY